MVSPKFFTIHPEGNTNVFCGSAIVVEIFRSKPQKYSKNHRISEVSGFYDLVTENFCAYFCASPSGKGLDAG